MGPLLLGITRFNSVPDPHRVKNTSRMQNVLPDSPDGRQILELGKVVDDDKYQ
jgi:hypothetical protein